MSKEITCPNCNEIIDTDLLSADPQRRRFFAAIREAHHNLSDAMRERFPSSEHLRKTALVNAGHCDVAQIVAGSERAAQDFSTFIRARDRYAVVVVSGKVLTVYTARSVSRAVLKKREFHAVAEAAFAWIATITGIDPAQSMAA